MDFNFIFVHGFERSEECQSNGMFSNFLNVIIMKIKYFLERNMPSGAVD